MKQTSCLILAFGLFIIPSCHESTQTSSGPIAHETIADFEAALNKHVADRNAGSFSAVIFKKDSIILSKTFGNADDQKGIKADTSTIYRIGSISKTITAYLLMLLVQKGVIRLDDPVANYLPEIKMVKQNGTDLGGEITFRQLASHTSGLEREPGLSNAAMGPIGSWETMVLNSIPTTVLHPPIGKNYSYSNIGYAILGLAISRAAHKPFIDLVEELVFRPHGMNSSFYIIPKGFEHRIAVGYSFSKFNSTYDSKQSEIELAGRGYKVPNGGAFTTANDLARFAMALSADTDVLAKNYRDTMQTIQTFESKDHGYGFGLMVNYNGPGQKIVGHSGLVAGFGACMVFNP